MANPNKAKGTAWESAVRDYLNRDLGLAHSDGTPRDPFSPLNVRRPAQEGVKDVGDVHAVPFILECKDCKSSAIPTWLRQTRVEAKNAGFPFGVAVVKLRRHGVHSGSVHFDVRTWTRVRLALGLKSADMYARYGFKLSMRGLDTSRWYFTSDVYFFSRILADVRKVLA
ncbi:MULTISPECIES: hypothetical protein [unclassified Kitasatospora]|uniref:hypothetical protein n=1 Tax=unclassified Kitasatospora TaxID=2633591 RepID=UPI0024753B53|nr:MULTISPECIES: hypothetical protein [unclassified Kitasatospora]MDH6123837.1 hypothetical protein [Kitasatospora sp. GP82]MDH6576064.1 hypothetical protein [Kitasatospora sp. MAP5-34]